jgi:hypothetical protein
MGPPKRGDSGPPGRRIVARRQALLCEQFSTPKPSLRHAPPSILVLGLACKFGHQLAFSGVLQKFFRRVHRGYYSLFLTPRTPPCQNTELTDPSKWLLGIPAPEKGDTSRLQHGPPGWKKRTAPVSPFEQNKNSRRVGSSSSSLPCANLAMRERSPDGPKFPFGVYDSSQIVAPGPEFCLSCVGQ